MSFIDAHDFPAGLVLRVLNVPESPVPQRARRSESPIDGHPHPDRHETHDPPGSRSRPAVPARTCSSTSALDTGRAGSRWHPRDLHGGPIKRRGRQASPERAGRDGCGWIGPESGTVRSPACCVIAPRPPVVGWHDDTVCISVRC